MTTKEKVGNADVKTQKVALRTEMKKIRNGRETDEESERALVENVCDALSYVFKEKTGVCIKRTALIYRSFSSEAPTDKLIECLQEKGYKVYCPRVDGENMHAVPFGENTTVSRFGIQEPIGEPFDGEMDLAILPLLAVDEQGNRLGYGKGFYDRWLEKNERTKRIGYCFDCQVIKSVPCERTDKKLDMVVTEKRWFFTEKNG